MSKRSRPKKPGPDAKVLSDEERDRLEEAEDRVAEAEAALLEAHREWAGVVRELGLSAVARELDISRQSIAERVAGYEKAAGPR